jgi:hypothetical protein
VAQLGVVGVGLEHSDEPLDASVAPDHDPVRVCRPITTKAIKCQPIRSAGAVLL